MSRNMSLLGWNRTETKQRGFNLHSSSYVYTIEHTHVTSQYYSWTGRRDSLIRLSEALSFHLVSRFSAPWVRDSWKGIVSITVGLYKPAVVLQDVTSVESISPIPLEAVRIRPIKHSHTDSLTGQVFACYTESLPYSKRRTRRHRQLHKKFITVELSLFHYVDFQLMLGNAAMSGASDL